MSPQLQKTQAWLQRNGKQLSGMAAPLLVVAVLALMVS